MFLNNKYNKQLEGRYVEIYRNVAYDKKNKEKSS